MTSNFDGHSITLQNWQTSRWEQTIKFLLDKNNSQFNDLKLKPSFVPPVPLEWCDLQEEKSNWFSPSFSWRKLVSRKVVVYLNSSTRPTTSWTTEPSCAGPPTASEIRSSPAPSTSSLQVSLNFFFFCLMYFIEIHDMVVSYIGQTLPCISRILNL